MATSTIDYWSDAPIDVLEDIFLRQPGLPMRTSCLYTLALVSKSFAQAVREIKPFVLRAQKGNALELENFFLNGLDPFVSDDWHRRNVTEWAVCGNSVECVKICRKYGGNIPTPTMYGSADDQDYIAGTLLAIRNELLAVYPQPPPVVRNYWLMTVPEGVVQDDAFAMIAAASVGDAATLTRLLDGPDGKTLLEAQDPEWKGTPFMWALYKDQLECAKICVQRGANVNAIANNTNSGFFWHLRYGKNIDVTKYVLSLPQFDFAYVAEWAWFEYYLERNPNAAFVAAACALIIAECGLRHTHGEKMSTLKTMMKGKEEEIARRELKQPPRKSAPSRR